MKINVLLFAYLKEVAGKPVIAIELPEPATAATLLDCIKTLYPDVANQVNYFKVSIDGEYVSGDAEIQQSSEVAIIPPVSGG